MKDRKTLLEIIIIFSFIAGICAAENILALIGCWAVTCGAYFIYHRICLREEKEGDGK